MALSIEQANAKRQQLTRDGYCVIENVVPQDLLEDLRQETDRLLDSVEHPPHWTYQGSDLHVNGRDNAVIDRLVKLQSARDALDAMGLHDFRTRSGFIILSKPPGGPALYWHQDWTHWNDPISAAPWPQYLFLSYYLVDTGIHNGCFQVIPGTHRKRIPLHDHLVTAHAAESYFAPEDDSALFAEQPDAVDVPVKAGSLVIGEGRLLHAARANQSDTRRTLLLGWYDRPATVPDYWTGDVPDVIRNRDDGKEYPNTRTPGEFLR
jgi:ectoine hydroxylase-related dioxygenase (phytanoyl-CoA dioxygenase family)